MLEFIDNILIKVGLKDEESQATEDTVAGGIVENLAEVADLEGLLEGVLGDIKEAGFSCINSTHTPSKVSKNIFKYMME